jgi:hypothetical protein
MGKVGQPVNRGIQPLDLLHHIGQLHLARSLALLRDHQDNSPPPRSVHSCGRCEKPIAERIKVRKCDLCPGPDDTAVPPDLGPGGFLYTIGELARLHKPDLSSLFAKTTGGRTLNFLKKDALEQAIQLIGEEVHRQYILSFEPKGGEAGKYHAIRVAVKDRADLRATTPDGYWALQ